ncbi:MAG TPA: NAD-dependent epimerase/dehydratase family protein [Victivallales bacterium]|nr:NAD-dependent epimerase/dehydratase family protein [Victivallales bacterium]
MENSFLLKHYRHKTLLITGASGYIASNIIEVLKNIDCNIIRVSRNSKNLPKINSKSNITDLEGNITNKSFVDGFPEVDIIFHLAAQTSTYMANNSPAEDFNINVKPIIHIVEKYKISEKLPVIIFAGSATEVGLTEKNPVEESFEDEPLTIYDLHKLITEEYLKLYTRLGCIESAILRLANVYGPGPASSSADRGILNMMIRKALADETLTIYGEGKFTRDYIYIEDVVSAFLMAPANIKKLNGKHFIIGSGTGLTINEAFDIIAKQVEAKTRKKVSIEHIPFPGEISPIETRNFVANSDMFSKLCKWKANYSFKEGTDKTVNHFINL